MSRLETIGRAGELNGFAPVEGEVAFAVRTQEDVSFGMAFTNEELDKVLEKGMERILGARALHHFDFVVKLEHPNLPFYVGAQSLQIDYEDGISSIEMGLCVVSQSIIDEHRGVMKTSRSGLKGDWRFVEYNQLPPLQHES